MNLAINAFVVSLLLLAELCKSQPVRRTPGITYVAGPNQLTLLLNENTFRFAYDTDNQFRAERRFPNGTVAGYFGYIGADGKAVRVKYGAVDELGFTAVQELIPDAFPETPVTEEAAAATDAPPVTMPEAPPAADAGNNRLPRPYEPIVDDVNESVSVDAIDFVEGRRNVVSSAPTGWRYPLVEDEELREIKRKTRAIMEPYRRFFRQGLVLEQHPGEPAIIYADPDNSQVEEDRYFKTASAQITMA